MSILCYSPQEAETNALTNALTRENCYFAVVGTEISESGTRHYQGFIHLKTRQRIAGAKRLVGMRAHTGRARGSDEENDRYCSKDGNVWLRIGKPCGGAGGGGSYHTYDTAREIARMPANQESILDIMAKGNDYVASYFRHAKVIQELAEIESLDKGIALASDVLGDPVLKKWQRDLLQLEGDPDPRKIIWYTFILTDPRNFITVLLVTREPEQTTLLF